MFRSLMRSTGAIILSLVVAGVLLVAIEAFSASVHPFPPEADPMDLEDCRAHVAQYPQWVLAVAAIGWYFTVFVSCWLATRLGTGSHPAHGIAVGLLLLLLAGFNMFLLPYPLWFETANYVIFPIAIFAAVRLGSRGRSPRTGAEADAGVPPDVQAG